LRVEKYIADLEEGKKKLLERNEEALLKSEKNNNLNPYKN